MPGAESKIYCYPQTREFLKTVFRKRTHLDSLNHAGREKTWIRNLNMTVSYFASDSTLEDIAYAYQSANQQGKVFSKQRISQIVGETVRILYTNSDPETKAKFPLESIPLTKPVSLKRLKARNGTSILVLNGLKQGLSVPEIMHENGLSGTQVDNSRPTLAKYGVEIPYLCTLPKENRRLSEKLRDTSLTDPEVQALLDQIKFGFIINERRAKDPVLEMTGNLIRRAGFHPRNFDLEMFLSPIKEANIPYREIRTEVKSGRQKGVHKYNFVARIHSERVIKLLLEQEALRKFLSNPVTQVAGPEDFPIPSTTQFIGDQKYEKAYSFARRVGVPIGRNGTNLENILDLNCPIPVYKIRGAAIFFPSDQKEAFAVYLQQRWADLSSSQTK